MIEEGMYVRCPIDFEFKDDPRQFALAKVKCVDRLGTIVDVEYQDPFDYGSYYDIRLLPTKFSIEKLEHCRAQQNAKVFYDGCEYKVVTRSKAENQHYKYRLLSIDELSYTEAIEDEIEIPFIYGDSDPVQQMRNYEFHNPRFYFGRQIAKSTMTVLENSIYGFKELTGCKIYLKAYQLDAIMRCVQTKPCRYMLADEVGLGKTIEAASVLKIFLGEKVDQNVLIIVPQSLLAQWKTELLFKFNLYEGINKNNNLITIKSYDEISKSDLSDNYDFLIVDEVHNYIYSQDKYEKIHAISKNSTNVLMLSATPVLQRQKEYLKLLRLIMPSKYDDVSEKVFEELVKKQETLSKKIYGILDDIDYIKSDFLPNIGKDKNAIIDLKDQLEVIQENLDTICSLLNDNAINEMLARINYEGEDFGIHDIQVVVSYVCENYQIENCIIRGRRMLLGIYPEDPDGQFAKRTSEKIEEIIDEKSNYYEFEAYNALLNWIHSNENIKNEEYVDETIKPILSSFFSSPWAYYEQLTQISKKGIDIDHNVIKTAKRWIDDEDECVTCLEEILDGEKDHTSKLIKIVDYIDNLPSGQKVVIFTDFKETFEKFYDVLSEYYGEDYVSAFGEHIDKDVAEINMYKFQSNSECNILICDKSGGEGRNLQNADVVIHTNLPWNINEIEQRIGRLDRLGRDVTKEVKSLIVYSKNTSEEQLYKLWNEGLNVFNQSLSGLEIIFGEINSKITKAIADDFDIGLSSIVPELIDYSKKMRDVVRKEQMFDATSKKYKPLYKQLERILSNYEFNENDLFEKTMMSWATTSGFEGFDKSSKNKTITFSEHKFSPRAAENTYLIPPNQDDYFTKKENVIAINAQRGLEEEKEHNITKNNRTIKGTFNRETAIKNDYIHFFAPGDEIFDCIIENAEQSYKGKSCAFIYGTNEVEWCGMVYTFSVQPKESVLINNNISPYEISQYRSFLSTKLIKIPVAFTDCNEETTKLAMKKYEQLISKGYSNDDEDDRYEHLGRRGKKGGFLYYKHEGISNADWFKILFSDEKWKNLVDTSYNNAKAKAFKKISDQLDINGVKELMESNISSLEASSKYFGLKSNELNEMKMKNESIINSLEKPVIKTESACFMWFRKYE